MPSVKARSSDRMIIRDSFARIDVFLARLITALAAATFAEIELRTASLKGLQAGGDATKRLDKLWELSARLIAALAAATFAKL